MLELETVSENAHVQTDFIPTFAFNRFLCIYQNSFYAELSITFDTIIGRYGSLNVDNENVKITFRLK